jgi:DNA polymerase III subunit delta
VPSLTLPALKQQIADRRLAPVYLFVGEDVKLMDRMVDSLESVVDPADRPFAVDRVYAGESNGAPQAIADASRILPMLGDRRLVIVLRAERLLKPKRASKVTTPDDESEDADAEPAPDARSLEDYLAQPVPSTTLAFVATEVDRGRRLTKRVIEAAHVVEFGGLGDGGRRDGRPGVAEWLKDELTRAGRTIEGDAVRLLVERSGRDITKLRGDVERLLLFAGARVRLTADDVMEVVAEQSAVDDDWAVVNAIAQGDAARALVETGRRFERGDSPHQLVGQLRWWVSARLASVDPARVRPAVEALLRTDLALKSSGGDERVLVERLVVELTGRPLPAQRGGWRS